MPDPRSPALYDHEGAAGDMGRGRRGSAGVMGENGAELGDFEFKAKL